jgi:hypothetical protein
VKGALAAFAVALVVAAEAGLGACTSGTTPDCDGGVCGYTIAETGSDAAEDANESDVTTSDAPAESSPPADSPGQ